MIVYGSGVDRQLCSCVWFSFDFIFFFLWEADGQVGGWLGGRVDEGLRSAQHCLAAYGHGV